MNKEDIQIVKNMYYAGCTMKEIGDRLRYSEFYIKNICREMRKTGTLKKRKRIAKSKVCREKPGKACLECKFEDCICTRQAVSTEETQMTECGFQQARKKKDETMCNLW
jgi:transposase